MSAPKGKGRAPFKRGLVYDGLAELGEADGKGLAKHLKMTVAAMSKLLAQMIDDGQVECVNRRRYGRVYSIVRGSERPIDRRGENKPPKPTRRPEITCYDTTPPWLFALWPYLPYGLELQYCVRLDTRVLELCPQQLQAAD